MSKCIITGGAGFIGAHLARAMVSHGHRVDLVDNLSRGNLDDDLAELQGSSLVRLLRGDLLQPGFLESLDADYEWVVHLAAVVGVANVVRRPQRTLRENVLMVDGVLSWAQGLQRLTRFLFPSTSEVYAGTLEAFGLPIPTPESVPLTIADVAAPRASYAVSKLYGESLCHHAGVPFTIIRPHNVYGPRMGLSHVIPELLERAYAAVDGDVLDVYSIDHRRTFCYIDDAVEIILRALEIAECAGQTLNVGSSGPEVSIGELASLVAEVVGKRLEIRALPPTPGSSSRRCPDMAKTGRLTGSSADIGLRTGLTRTYEWYRRHIFEPGAGRGACAAP